MFVEYADPYIARVIPTSTIETIDQTQDNVIIAKITDPEQSYCSQYGGRGGGDITGATYVYKMVDGLCQKVWSDGRIEPRGTSLEYAIHLTELVETEVITEEEVISHISEGIPISADIPQVELPEEEQTIREFTAYEGYGTIGEAFSNTMGWIGEGIGNILGFASEKILSPALSGLFTGLLGENWKTKLIIAVVVIIIILIVILIGYFAFKTYFTEKIKKVV